MEKRLLLKIVTLFIIILGLSGCTTTSFSAKEPSYAKSHLSTTSLSNNNPAPAYPTPQRIALLLPLSGPHGNAGQQVRTGFLQAYYATRNNGNKPNITFYDTHQTKDMTALYQQAVTEGADFIIGPLLKGNVQQLSSLRRFSKPTLALNYSDRPKTSLPSNFFEFGLKQEDEAEQIATRARRAGNSRALIIAPRDEWGDRVMSAFATKWENSGGIIQQTWRYSKTSNFTADIASLLRVNPDMDKKLMQENNRRDVLEQQRRQDFDVVFLFARPEAARVIVPLLRYNYVTNVPIYASSSINIGKFSENDFDLKGVIVCDTPRNKHASHRLQAVGEDAYLLSLNLTRMAEFPNYPLDGSTGALTLTPEHFIRRSVPCAAVGDNIA